MKQARPPRRGGVYCVRPRRRPARWALYAAAVSMAAGLLSACVGQVGRVLAPEGFGGVPCMPEPAAESRDTGDPERPYSRGRAYDPAHYGRKRPAGSDAEQTEE